MCITAHVKARKCISASAATIWCGWGMEKLMEFNNFVSILREMGEL